MSNLSKDDICKMNASDFFEHWLSEANKITTDKEIILLAKNNGIVLTEYFNRCLEKLDKENFLKLLKVTVFLSIEINKINLSGADKARAIHFLVDFYAKEFLLNFNSINKNQQIKCKNNCSNCCFQAVTITEDEAKLLSSKINNDHIIKLKNQKNWSKHEYIKNYPLSKCVFLDESNSCSIYEDRPSICRTVFVNDTNAPKQCDVRSKTGVQFVLSLTLEAVCCSIFTAYKGKTDLMPKMILAQIFKN